MVQQRSAPNQMAAQDVQQPEGKNLRVSSVLREFDSFLDSFDMEAEKSPADVDTSNKTRFSGSDSEDHKSGEQREIMELEWNSLLRKRSLETPGEIPRLNPSPRTKESQVISELFDFLPKDTDSVIAPTIAEEEPEGSPDHGGSPGNGEVSTTNAAQDAECSDLVENGPTKDTDSLIEPTIAKEEPEGSPDHGGSPGNGKVPTNTAQDAESSESPESGPTKDTDSLIAPTIAEEAPEGSPDHGGSPGNATDAAQDAESSDSLESGAPVVETEAQETDVVLPSPVVEKQNPDESTSSGEIVSEDVLEDAARLSGNDSIPAERQERAVVGEPCAERSSETPQPELRNTQIINDINDAFDFLPEGAENDATAKKLSTVIEANEVETDKLSEPDVAADRGVEKTKKQVRLREKSRSPARTLSRGQSVDPGDEDSEEDDDEVHVMPGAWRNSSFAYVGKDGDTETESSANSTPRSASPVTEPERLDSDSRLRPSSMFPPSPMQSQRNTMISNGDSSNQDSRGLVAPANGHDVNQVPNGTISTPEVRILSATDSERDFSTSIDEDPLNRSEDSDAFEPIEKELMFKQKKEKRKWLHKPSKSRSESLSSVSTTASEREFRSKYRSLQKTRILRNASTSSDVGTSTKNAISQEVDHEVLLEREEASTGFGFHIWGKKPVIVSTVEPGGIAERAGLKIGDALVAVNDINVVDENTNQVVQIIGRGTRKVKLGIGEENLVTEIPLCCGYLNKQCGNLLIKKWRKRWVELKPDHCLYYYKSEGDVDPLGAVPVVNYSVTKAPEISADFAFKLTKYSSKTYHFVADSEAEMCRWANAINQAAQQKNKANTWLDISAHNVSLPALDIRSPDCHGHLYKMGNSNRTWRRRYCVLKDACLYYYVDVSSSMAKGVAHFHGYSVQGSMPYKKQHGFMLMPPEPEMRTFFFYAENETEQKRWLAAFQDSISKWVKIE